MINGLGLQLSRRRRAAWIAFTNFRDVFYDAKATLSVKAELFNSTVLPLLLDGCETWNTTLAEEIKLAKTQLAMERRMVDVSRQQHIRNEGLRSRSGVKYVVEKKYKRKQGCAGHLARMKNNRWTKRIAEWNPRDARRPSGRPPTRREGPLRRLYGAAWMRLAQDHERRKICQLHR
ncbi:Putative uncharacterized transposon-derived protein F52C9.6, partial [Toxocara canis]